METIERRSPLVFERPVKKQETRDYWNVVLEYEDEGPRPYLVDLSHRTRWDIQDNDLVRYQPHGLHIPKTAGHCRFQNGLLINRMNRTQAAIWHLAGGKLDDPEDPAYTETTDATVFLGLLGKDVFAVAEKLSALDFLEPGREPPFLLQGPFAHVPCQIVTLEHTNQRPGILLTCSRGYAQDMVHAILDAGAEFGLQPAGENAFNRWIV